MSKERDHLPPVDAVSDWWACVACGIERTDAEPTEERDGGCHHLDRCPNCGDDRMPEARTDHDEPTGCPPDRSAEPLTRELADRFWSYVHKTDGCWLWTGGLMNKGYGTFWAGRSLRAHRVAYELCIGPIPEGLTLDHLCRVRRCVNPAHLEPVTIRENVMRGEGITAALAARDYCVNGHPLTGDNLRIDAHGHRRCRTCGRAKQAAYKARRVAEGSWQSR